MDLKASLHELRVSGKWSDFTMKCNFRVIRLHKCIVCLQSKWFSEQVHKGPWKRGFPDYIEIKPLDGKHGETGFRFDDDSKLELMIDFMYLGDYALKSVSQIASTEDHRPSMEGEKATPLLFPPLPSSDVPKEPPAADLQYDQDSALVGYRPTPSTPRGGSRARGGLGAREGSQRCANINRVASTVVEGCLLTHTKMYVMGLQYDIPSLKKVAVEKLKASAADKWETSDFASALAFAYGGPLGPDGDFEVREIFVKTILGRSKLFAVNSDLRQAINRIDGLVSELFRRQSLDLSTAIAVEESKE